ncbi:hydrogen peroxide-inducible genes activator [Candidatus Spongiihabitans sp.]|uniref:hydrogen peroxide-inducible genes activator n=1 Tax=Candidatus Spongiihabitans sp. TaxID=3101308 RepID=UPI003C7DCE65
MTLSELKYIVAVARERHFGRAARSCFVSQPTLSVAVKKLEHEFDITLFERGSNEILLTPMGKRMVEQAQQVLEAAAKLKTIARASDNDLVEPLRIGIIYTICPYLLPHLIPILREQAADMPIIVEEGFTNDLRVRLKQGSVDAIIVSNPFAEPGVATEVLYKEPFVVVLPISHPLAQKNEIDIAELESETVLLLRQGNCFRDQVLEVCPACQRGGGPDDLQKTLESGSIETMRHMVASGVGITILPCSAVGAEEYSGRLLSIKCFADIKPGRDVILAWRKGYPREQAIQALTAAIHSCPLSCVEMAG